VCWQQDKNLKVSMFKSLKTLDPRFREGDRKEVVAGMTKGVGENDGKGVSGDDKKSLATPDLAKRDHSRVLLLLFPRKRESRVRFRGRLKSRKA